MEALEYFNFIFGRIIFDTVHHLEQDGTQKHQQGNSTLVAFVGKDIGIKVFKVKEKKTR